MLHGWSNMTNMTHVNLAQNIMKCESESCLRLSIVVEAFSRNKTTGCFLAGFLNIHLIRVKTFAACLKKRQGRGRERQRGPDCTPPRWGGSTAPRWGGYRRHGRGSGYPRMKIKEFFCRVGNWEIHHSTCVSMIWNFHKILYDKISPCYPPFKEK